MKKSFEALVKEAKKCNICADLPLGPSPLFQVHPKARILIIGQAPGTKAHNSMVTWDDASGDRLRSWMGLEKVDFYDETKVATLPMGFCYPGRGKSGDLPPRKECAPQWHDLLMAEMKEVQLTLLIGAYAQKYYLKEKRFKTLTETVKNFNNYLPEYFPMVHPSPRNNIWMAKNEWFEVQVVPVLREIVRGLVGD